MADVVTLLGCALVLVLVIRFVSVPQGEQIERERAQTEQRRPGELPVGCAWLFALAAALVIGAALLVVFGGIVKLTGL